MFFTKENHDADTIKRTFISAFCQQHIWKPEYWSDLQLWRCTAFWPDAACRNLWKWTLSGCGSGAFNCFKQNFRPGFPVKLYVPVYLSGWKTPCIRFSIRPFHGSFIYRWVFSACVQSDFEDLSWFWCLGQKLSSDADPAEIPAGSFESVQRFSCSPDGGTGSQLLHSWLPQKSGSQWSDHGIHSVCRLCDTTDHGAPASERTHLHLRTDGKSADQLVQPDHPWLLLQHDVPLQSKQSYRWLCTDFSLCRSSENKLPLSDEYRDRKPAAVFPAETFYQPVFFWDLWAGLPRYFRAPGDSATADWRSAWLYSRSDHEWALYARGHPLQRRTGASIFLCQLESAYFDPAVKTVCLSEYFIHTEK